ncbi:MAG: exodeoxyribonuclease VII small subunit [Limibaculum sp.]|jgi:exodeoxyribonuclease VII small subunit|nr:exodeoxyribonuclease VII small subunit [Pseudomonadota bacterium]
MTDKPIDGPIAELTFEQALAALEQVVSQLEGGQVPLEQSIALYERGDALKKHCEAKLGEAELKVEKIVAGGDGTAAGTAPFNTE